MDAENAGKEEDAVDSKRGGEIWHALQELGFRTLVGGVISLVVISASTSAGVAVWAASRADIGAVSQNSSAIRAIRDTISMVRDVDDTQDRLINALGLRVDGLEAKFDTIIGSQTQLRLRMDRLLCRMDGASANRCDLLYR